MGLFGELCLGSGGFGGSGGDEDGTGDGALSVDLGGRVMPYAVAETSFSCLHPHHMLFYILLHHADQSPTGATSPPTA